MAAAGNLLILSESRGLREEREPREVRTRMELPLGDSGGSHRWGR